MRSYGILIVMIIKGRKSEAKSGPQLMTHEHDFKLDLDGQVTCSKCGAMDNRRDV